jgi:hypothetical protein
MATPTSSVPRAKAALRTLLDTDTTLAQVKKVDPPGPADRIPHEFIYLARPSDGRSASSAQTSRIGNRSRQEEYDLYLTITCGKGGYASNDARVFELMSALELAIAADPQLLAYNGGQLIGQPFQITGWDFDLDSFPVQDAGNASQLVVTLSCRSFNRNQ